MDQKNKKYRVESLGCRVNQYEAQALREGLAELGYVAAEPGQEADLVIVNTCTVTESADASSRHLIRKLRRRNPKAKIVVTGCFATRDRESVSKMAEVDLVVPNTEKEQLLSLISDAPTPPFCIHRFEGHVRAFVKVQDGCNSFCSYCIVPYVRGRSRSRAIDEVVRECTSLVRSGYKEIVITGINVGDYKAGTETLADLIRACDKIPGLCRLRISSIDPNDLDDDLTRAILQCSTVCPSMHIVLQSGSDRILRAMQRRYSKQEFLEAVARLRGQNPDFTLTTDIIVGFPGEEEADFEETLGMVRTVRFAKVHVFPYSDRKGSRASTFPLHVRSSEIKRRTDKLLECAESVAFSERERSLGRQVEILSEDNSDPDMLSGHTSNFLPVFFARGNFSENELLTVELLQNTPQGFFAKVIP
jgi:threonylcarbamoyladenosine tRNA methylthiotransferase MtaB